MLNRLPLLTQQDFIISLHTFHTSIYKDIFFQCGVTAIKMRSRFADERT